jgi:hypothetical protein
VCHSYFKSLGLIDEQIHDSFPIEFVISSVDLLLFIYLWKDDRANLAIVSMFMFQNHYETSF